MPRTLLMMALLAVFFATNRTDAQTTGAKSPANVVVRLPGDAAIFFDDTATQSKGDERLFTTPPLERGRVYSYTLKFAWQGKELTKKIDVKAGEVTTLVIAAADFPAVAKANATPPNRKGFHVMKLDGHFWIFREGSKEEAAALKGRAPEKHVSRANVEPWKVTLGAPDNDTLVAYLIARDGFETFVKDGRIWVFRTGAKELAEYKKHGDLAKHVTRVNAGPLGMTVKAPDTETLEAYRRASAP